MADELEAASNASWGKAVRAEDSPAAMAFGTELKSNEERPTSVGWMSKSFAVSVVRWRSTSRRTSIANAWFDTLVRELS